jgi:glycosyltransferase involved in cell wall biosynthesis
MGRVAMPVRDEMVSCLMVTLPVPERLHYLKRSVRSYCEQTHARKELVIVTDAGSRADKVAIADHIVSLGRSDIRMIDPTAKLTLGALRNLGRASAAGGILCHWDDDDLYHPRRLELQVDALETSGGQGLSLQEVMLYFSGPRTLYCTNWRATPVQGLPSSLMFRRSAPIRYPEAFESPPSEDTAVVLQLQEARGLSLLEGCAHLYVYVCHSANSWPEEHHRMLASRLGISRGLLLRREATLREELRFHDFGDGSVTVQGSNGPAFVLGPEALTPSEP